MGDDVLPQWISSTLEIKEGRDPLGLQTTTQDRLMPLLLPGVLEPLGLSPGISRSTRSFLTSTGGGERAPDNRTPSAFIKHREWEFRAGRAVVSARLWLGARWR